MPNPAAHNLLSAALDAYVSDNRALAQQRLIQALQANPALAQDERFGKLAGEILQTSPEQAVQTLLDQEKRREIMAHRSKSPKSPIRKTVSRALLLISTIILIALGAWFIDSGRLRDYWLVYKVRQITDDVQRLPNGQEYYVVVPSGSPPKNGWDVLVGLHGYGGTGKQMLTFDLFDIAEDENAILIAPNFWTYDDHRSLDDLKHSLNAILDDVAAKYPVNPRGAVLYGFSRGGMFAMSFMDGYSHRIRAIVTDGAPEIPLPPAGTYLRPLHFVYGERDGLQDFTYPNAQALRNVGYTVTFEIVRGAGHQMTGTALDWVREMLRAG